MLLGRPRDGPEALVGLRDFSTEPGPCQSAVVEALPPPSPASVFGALILSTPPGLLVGAGCQSRLGLAAFGWQKGLSLVQEQREEENIPLGAWSWQTTAPSPSPTLFPTAQAQVQHGSVGVCACQGPEAGETDEHMTLEISTGEAVSPYPIKKQRDLSVPNSLTPPLKLASCCLGHRCARTAQIHAY